MHIISDFIHDHKRYIISKFDHEGDTREFLYFTTKDGLIRSLFFGEDLMAQIQAILTQENGCIECSLGVSILGGISVDTGDMIEHGLDIGRANKIIKKINQVLKEPILQF